MGGAGDRTIRLDFSEVTPASERLGVFGGTFDPPHIGHLVAALYCFHALSLDRVLFVISGEPWQKVGTRRITPVEDRIALVRAAIDGRPEFDLSLVDVERPGPSYTVDTLADLREQHPRADLWLIVGADAAAGIPTWHRPEALPALARLAVVTRPGASQITLPGFDISTVVIPSLDISSTDLRARVTRGDPITWLVPDGVRSLIEGRLLYRDAR